MTVTLPDIPVFTVTLELEAARCPDCGLDNVHERRPGQVAKAVTDALEAGVIGPAASEDAVINVGRSRPGRPSRP